MDSDNHALSADRFLTVDFVMQLFDVSRPTIDEWFENGLAHYRLGPRTIRIDRADLEAFLARHRRVAESKDEAPPATTRKGRQQLSAAAGEDIRSRCSSPGSEESDGVAA